MKFCSVGQKQDFLGDIAQSLYSIYIYIYILEGSFANRHLENLPKFPRKHFGKYLPKTSLNIICVGTNSSINEYFKLQMGYILKQVLLKQHFWGINL